MSTNGAPRLSLALSLAVGLSLPGRAQNRCFEWQPGLFPRDVLGATDLRTLDDGSGPALYAVGDFTQIGDVTANRVARWNGSAWAPLGTGIPQIVRTITAHDDGQGRDVFVAGDFSGVGTIPGKVARWNGSEWSIVGSGAWTRFSRVERLASFDGGGGSLLVAAGDFALAGGVSARGIAAWDGTAWSPLGAGIDGFVNALLPFGDATAARVPGPALYVAGALRSAGESPAVAVARWDGLAWTAMDDGLEPLATVTSIAVLDAGDGPTLYSAGRIDRVADVPTGFVRRWDGSRWTAVGPTFLGYVSDLGVFDFGTGPTLVRSTFRSSGPFESDAGPTEAWDGSGWATMSDGDLQGIGWLAVFDDGHGAALYSSAVECRFGRNFDSAVLGKWTGSAWSPLTDALDDSVSCLAVAGQGPSSRLIVGGGFCRAGGVAAHHVAAWDGRAWSALGTAIRQSAVYETIGAIVATDAGGRQATFVGGTFTRAGDGPASNVAEWTGDRWLPLGSGTDGSVEALAVVDVGGRPSLVAGGYFEHAGGQTVNGIARWNGVSWSPLGAGIAMGPRFTDVRALATFDDGSGPALYAGGEFHVAGDAAANNVARWDGRAWTALGDGLDAGVSSMIVFDDGSGPALFVGGSFSHASGVAAAHLAKWNGSEWSALPSEITTRFPDSPISALAVFDDAAPPSAGHAEPALYVGGELVSAGGIPVSGVARFDGTSWSALGSGVDGRVESLAVFDDGGGPALWAGGYFMTAGGAATTHLAKWGPADAARGSVYAASGRVVDTLIVDGSRGDAGRRVHAAVGQPVSIALRSAPAGPSAPNFVLWIWPGAPAARTPIRALGRSLGCTIAPTPLDAGLAPQPFLCLRGSGVPHAACSGIHERRAPARGPWEITKRGGFSVPRTLTVQGLESDAGARDGTGMSITNAVILDVGP
jgi:hypothetical protein